MKRTLKFLKKEAILVIASIFALISSIYVKPSYDFFSYINYKVLICMFCLMASVSGLYNENLFNFTAVKLLKKVTNFKLLAIIIISITFIFGMLMTNDAVLITLVPFTILVCKEAKQEKYIIYIVILQTLAANLGSALTPMGDPQNIYLYTKFSIGFFSFLKATIPITLVGFLLITLTTLILIPKRKIDSINYTASIKSNRIFVYLSIFIITILSIVNIINEFIVLGLTLILLVFSDIRILKRVDYSLLFTFLMFFIFTGNVVKIKSLTILFTKYLNSGKNVYFISLFISQIISNVPAAVLLSSFVPEDLILYLIQGVNVGAMGSLIASLASLISYKFVIVNYPKQSLKYILIYTLICIIYIFVITLVVLYFKSFN